MPVTRRKFVINSGGVLAGFALQQTLWAESPLETTRGTPGESVELLGTARRRMAFTPAWDYRPYTSKIAGSADATTWVQIDLGSSQAIQAVELYPTFVLGKEHRIGFGFPVRFRVDASDDPSFAKAVPIASQLDQDFTDPGDLITSFRRKGVSGRYVRLTATRLAPAMRGKDTTDGLEMLGEGYSLGLSKIAVLSNGSDIAVGRPVTADERLGNPESLAQITRKLRPMGEEIVTDCPENVLPVSQWRPPASKATVPRRGVTIDGGPLAAAMDHNIEYLLNSFSVDHMLQPFRERAGKPAPSGNRPQVHMWDTDLPGSNAGRFLMGAGNTLRWKEHAELRRRMNEIVDGIAKCRQPNGYILAYPEDTIFYHERGAYTRSWVTHGLIEAGYAGNEKAWPLLRGFYDWFDQQPYLKNMLRGCCQGNQGMIANTRMYFTPVGKPREIEISQRYFQEDYWLEGLAARDKNMIWQYPYDRPHCYLLTEFEAYMDLYRATGDPRYLRAMHGGWDLFVENWLFPGGCTSIKEFLIDPPKSYYLDQVKLGELCGNSFWIFLNQRFHCLFPNEEKYVAEIERSIYNMFLANQRGGSGIRSFAKFVNKKWDATEVNTCCEGQGTRLIGSYPEHIYSVAQDGLYVNLYTPSTIEWTQGSGPLHLRTQTDFPFDPHVRITVSTKQPVQSNLRLRIPSWASDTVNVQVNGEAGKHGEPGTYLEVDRQWANGDTLTFTLPMALTLTRYVGEDQFAGHQRYALLYGPILMAAVGKPDPVMYIEPGQQAEAVLKQLKPVPGSPLHFTVDRSPGVVYQPYWMIDTEVFSCFPEFDSRSAIV